MFQIFQEFSIFLCFIINFLFFLCFISITTNHDFIGEFNEVFQEKLEFSLKWDAVFSIHYMIYIQFPYDTKDVRCIISSTSLKLLKMAIIKYKEQFEQDTLCFNTKFTTEEGGRLLAQQEFNNHFNQKIHFPA